MRKLLLCLLAFGLAESAYAGDRGSMLTAYSRTELSILRKGLRMDPNLLPWQQAKAIENSKLRIEVEVRDGRSLYGQEGWFNLTSYDDNKGVLLLFDSERITPIINSAQYQPVDILFLNAQGVVTQIVPSIQLAELREQITPRSPVLGFLFLRSGICEKLVISPGDVVDMDVFERSPVILADPPPCP